MADTRQPPDSILPTLAGTWRLDTAATTVRLHTRAMWGMVKVTGHFTPTEGSAEVTEDGAATGTIVIDAASVNTRQSMRDTHLRSKDFFDVDTYPTFTYTATSAQSDRDGGLTISGAFTAHGHTHPLDVHATIASTHPDRLAITGEADLNRAEWGVDWTKLGARLDNHIVVTAVFARL